MRKDGLLLLLALFLSFLSGTITFSLRSDNEVGFDDLEKIRKLHQDLRESLVPHRRLDLNTDYSDSEKLKLLDLSIDFSDKKIVLNSSECLKAKIQQISSNFINKEDLWLGYLCNQVSKLPRDFFSSPPYLHSNGLSFAYMRFRMLRSKYQKREWLNKYGQFMHISELKKLNWSNSYNHRFLVNLRSDVLNKILTGVNLFMDEKFYFIKTGTLQYFVIEREKAENYFALARYRISEKKPGCDLNIVDICWEKTPYNISGFLSQSSTILFIFTLVFLAIIAINLSLRIKKQKMEEEKKKHALRVLTHELRTPIAALLLQINNLWDKNPAEELQKDLAQIEGEIYRLKFLADKSKSYLQTDVQKAQVFKEEKIDSIRHLCEEVIADFPNQKIRIEAEDDCSLITDHYWLMICLKNLIENAIRYGQAPIKVILKVTEKEYQIMVEDAGELPFKNIKQLLKTKHKESVGLGIGLMIVHKTINQMGAKLSLLPSPTKFIISFPRRKK